MIVIPIVIGMLSLSAFAQTNSVRGYVRDSLTQMPLPGATVVGSTGKVASTDENGFFEISSAQAEVRFVGYKPKTVDLVDNIVILLREDVVLTEEVIVSATRATEKMGATFSNINKLTLQKQNFGQDLPIVLNWTPSLVTTSDAGGGIGYTGLRIRGSDATRINVTINGVPYNDSESQGVFWVNVPDIATSTQSVQIQRGVGTSTNGAGAFGASINLQTNVRNDKPYADVINSFGTFNTHRHTIGVGTGLINNMFAFDARVSSVNSDGYIDRGFSNLKSFYVAGGYYGKKTMVKAIVFGGQEITYQSWNLVPESKLNNDNSEMQTTIDDLGWYDNDALKNNLLNSNRRTFNAFIYPNQVDNYKQDNYQLHFSHRFNDDLTVNAAGHYTKGRGYYEEYRYNDSFASYGIASDSSTDLVRQRWLTNDFYGLTFSLNYDDDEMSSILGGGINRYDGDHFGKVIWSAKGPFDVDYQYYFNNGVKDDMNFYWKNTYKFTEAFSGFLDLQYRGVSYKTYGIENKQNEFNIDAHYNFFNPKVGLTYTIGPMSNLYASFSVGNREPVRDDFVDGALTGITPKAENLNDFEAGWRYRKNAYMLSVNYYYMGYKDQLVLTGALNDVGASLRTNVDKSYRTGIELEAQGRLSPMFSFGANLTLSQNKVLDFTETLYDYGENFDEYNVIEKKYKSSDISFSPNVIAGGIFSFTPEKGLEISLLTKYVGKQYLDNTSNESRTIDPYFTNDIRVTYTIHPKGMREISFSVLWNNVFDVEYESNGYTYGYFLGQTEIRQNYYSPQAGTNFMGMVALRF